MTSGVYMFTCSKNGDRYIGSSVNIESRKSGHIALLRNGKHHNKHFLNVWRKYGEDSFEFQVLEIVNDISRLVEREQYWIDTLKPEINKAIFANSGFLGKKHNEDTKRKLSQIQKSRMMNEDLRKIQSEATKRYIQLHGNQMQGKNLSAEAKDKIRQSAIRQFLEISSRNKHHEAMKRWMTDEMRERIRKKKIGKKAKDDTKIKMSLSHKKLWSEYSEMERSERIRKTSEKVVKAKAKMYDGFVSPSGEVFSDIYNLSDFCRSHNLSVSKMCLLNKGKIDNHKGWRKL